MSEALLQHIQDSQNRPFPRVILWEPPSLRHPSRESTRRWRVKRLFDLFTVSLTAPVWLPALLLIAIAVKMSAPGAPVFFTQRRVGQLGRTFPMIKFRTMTPGADKLKDVVRRQSELAWPDFKVAHDPRVTLLGRFLRRTSLDELPQLFNVLRGEMSFVGPRPTSFSVTTYAHWQRARLAAPPGLTGSWQVDGRGSSDFDQRARQDIDYIERQSLLLDLKILWRTISVVVWGKGGC